MKIIYQTKNVSLPEEFLQEHDLKVRMISGVNDSVSDPNIDVSLDQRLHNHLMELENEGEEIEAIIISLSLSDNPLDSLGLIFAHHIRLTRQIKFNQVPLIIYGTLDLSCLYQLTNWAYILGTPMVHYVDLKSTYFDGITEALEQVKLSKTFDFNQCIKRLVIDRPNNYKTHHSIANEWALIRWNEMLNLKLEDNINKNITSMLFFKYQDMLLYQDEKRQKFGKKHFKSAKIENIKGHTFCLIDDKHDKGWEPILREIIECKSEAILECYDAFNTLDKKQVLIDKLKIYIKEQIDIHKSKERQDQSDVISFIIDLRLHEEDFKCKFEDISGYQLVKYIQKTYPGIQIVMLTASDKVKSYQKARKLDLIGYAIKESPENHYSREESENLYSQFVHAVQNCVYKSFLFTMHSDIKAMNKKAEHYFSNIEEGNGVEMTTFFGRDGTLNNIYGILSRIESMNHPEPKVLNFCFLLLYQITEHFAGLYLESDNKHMNVILKDRSSIKLKYESPINGKMELMSFYDFNRQAFDFQSTDTESIHDIVFFKEAKNLKNDKKIVSSSLIKICGVAYYRYGFSSSEIHKILELVYLRNNLVVHMTGNVDTKKRSIGLPDIQFFLKVIKRFLELN